jgi:hypothetical protein
MVASITENSRVAGLTCTFWLMFLKTGVSTSSVIMSRMPVVKEEICDLAPTLFWIAAAREELRTTFVLDSAASQCST